MCVRRIQMNATNHRRISKRNAAYNSNANQLIIRAVIDDVKPNLAQKNQSLATRLVIGDDRQFFVLFRGLSLRSAYTRTYTIRRNALYPIMYPFSRSAYAAYSTQNLRNHFLISGIDGRAVAIARTHTQNP